MVMGDHRGVVYLTHAKPDTSETGQAGAEITDEMIVNELRKRDRLIMSPRLAMEKISKMPPEGRDIYLTEEEREGEDEGIKNELAVTGLVNTTEMKVHLLVAQAFKRRGLIKPEHVRDLPPSWFRH